MKKDFEILEDGTVKRDTIPGAIDNAELYSEYSKLEYEVNHLSRPTNDPAKIARYHELRKLLNIDITDSIAVAKQKLREKAGKTDSNNVLKSMLEKFKLENE